MALVMDAGALVLLVVLHPLRVSERPAVSDTAIKGNAFPEVVVNFISVILSVVPRLQV